MRPSSYQNEMKSTNVGTLQLAQTWHKYGSCREGTIPIYRKGKVYNPTILRKNHHPKFSPYKTLNISEPKDIREGHEYLVIELSGNFLGAQAKINLWKPIVETPSEISVSQIWVSAGEEEVKNTIEAGWIVSQKVYGDDKTRFFIYWTTDGYKSSGCYNLLCDGFVHTSSDVSPGCSFSEVSTLNGSQKDAHFNIHRVRKYKSSSNPVGYYPNILLTQLSRAAKFVQFGGEISNTKSKGQYTSTQMGSGHFPSEGGLKTSSYFNWVQVIDENNKIRDAKDAGTVVTNPNCYDLKITKDHYDTNGYGFYYGGPGYNDKCR
ncbi:hypothetical protein MKW98_018993 [Papaver atlanticum]|uniref:Neprosin PEP catalytic domain-containing protein n=1 Tax=Papaver atlanticum TaxID=357466 RepID=A0AAD4TJ65_9MAGN|nr:hypothetical protein MKW98_018993 [Papaver atlanticum]